MRVEIDMYNPHTFHLIAEGKEDDLKLEKLKDHTERYGSESVRDTSERLVEPKQWRITVRTKL